MKLFFLFSKFEFQPDKYFGLSTICYRYALFLRQLRWQLLHLNYSNRWQRKGIARFRDSRPRNWVATGSNISVGRPSFIALFLATKNQIYIEYLYMNTRCSLKWMYCLTFVYSYCFWSSWFNFVKMPATIVTSTGETKGETLSKLEIEIISVKTKVVLEPWVVSQIWLDSDSNESSQSWVGRENQWYESS